MNDPALLEAKRAERRLGAILLAAGLAIAVGALATLVHAHVVQRPRSTALGASVYLALLAAMWIFGYGLHRAMWAPRHDETGVPPRVRPWLSATFTLFAWVALIKVADVVGAWLRPR